MRGTFEDLEMCGANIVAIGSLVTLGNAAQGLADAKNVALVSLVSLPNALWSPPECPLCRKGVPLEDVASFRVAFADRTTAE